MNKIKSFSIQGLGYDALTITICILPIWIFENIISTSLLIIIYFIIILSSFLLILFFINRIKNKNRKKILLSIFFSLIFFYGIDSKVGFWVFFENITSSGISRYLLSFIALIFFTSLIYKLLLKNFLKIKKIFFYIIFILFINNLLINYFFHLKYKNIENISIDNLTAPSEQKKTIILFLDQMVGFSGINEDIAYGKLAKQSYLDLARKNDLSIFGSAYTIYQNTVEAIPSMLNFDFQVEKNNLSKYSKENLIDKKTKWKLKENKFFKQNKNKKIFSSKNQAINFCNNLVTDCIASNAINNYKKYSNGFLFSEHDYFIKKMYNQKSIIFQYFWRLLLTIDKLNDYHYLTFHKVKFANDLKNFEKIILNTNYDIYLTHFLFPHPPFAFDVYYDEKKCKFNKRNIGIIKKGNKEKTLSQHYKEIICTNFYLDNFLTEIKKGSTSSNLEIFIISDTGVRVDEENQNKDYFKNLHSVLFSVYKSNQKFSFNNKFISSQELFSEFLNPFHKNNLKRDEHKVFYSQKKKFKILDKF